MTTAYQEIEEKGGSRSYRFRGTSEVFEIDVAGAHQRGFGERVLTNLQIPWLEFSILLSPERSITSWIYMYVMSSIETAIVVKPTNSCDLAGAQPLLGGSAPSHRRKAIAVRSSRPVLIRPGIVASLVVKIIGGAGRVLSSAHREIQRCLESIRIVSTAQTHHSKRDKTCHCLCSQMITLSLASLSKC